MTLVMLFSMTEIFHSLWYNTGFTPMFLTAFLSLFNTIFAVVQQPKSGVGPLVVGDPRSHRVTTHTPSRTALNERSFRRTDRHLQKNSMHQLQYSQRNFINVAPTGLLFLYSLYFFRTSVS